MNFLETILSHKREEVATRKKLLPRAELREMAAYRRPTISLEGALRGKAMAFIAEIKKASPSKQVMREQFNPVEIAREYFRAGASALSVLTDERFFQGDLRFIPEMRESVAIPILRKDFIIDSFQLYESRANGADAVLLIAAVLGRAELTDLFLESQQLGLESLVEVHSEEEIEMLDFSLMHLVGINNRNLTTFDTDLNTTFRLQKRLPKDVLIVSESGISTRDDVDQLMSNGIHAALIGEHFMRAEHPGIALGDFIAHVQGVRIEG